MDIKTFIKKILDLVSSNLAVTLTILTALSYYCTFQYEKGICNVYNIPENLIEVGLNNLLIFATFITVFLPVPVFLFYLFLQLPNIFDENHKFKPIATINTWLIVALLAFSFVEERMYFLYIVSPIFLIISNLVFFYGVKVTRIKYRNAKNRIENENPDWETTVIKDKALDSLLIVKHWSLVKKVAIVYFLAFFLVFVPGFFNRIGLMIANNKHQYEVLNEKRNIVLLRKYGDSYVFRNLERSVLGKELIVIKQSPQYPLLLRDTTLNIKNENKIYYLFD